MPFPRKLLNDGEDVILDLRPHWWFLSKPIFVTALTLVGAIVLRNVEYASLVALVLMAISVLWLLVRWLKWTTTNFVLTTDRLISRKGVLSKSGREIPLERINDISVNQTLFERLIRSGDLLIESAGERGQQHFPDMSKPFLVQNAIYAEMERAAARDADRMAGARQLSIPEQIEKLDELRQRGVISNAEFEAKKSQLLDRM